MDSLRRYDPDQVLRDSLSHCRLWQWHPGRGRNLMRDGTSPATCCGVMLSIGGFAVPFGVRGDILTDFLLLAVRFGVRGDILRFFLVSEETFWVSEETF